MFHMPLATSMEIASPGDTGRAFIHAIDKKEMISKKIFNLSGGEKCRTTYQELLSRSFDIFGLGKLDFPDKAFAEKNFHCGYYDDGDELNNILHFRTETLDDYYRCEKLKVSVWKKALTYGLKSQINSYLLKKSEPYQAHKTNDPEMIKRYFYV